MTRFFSTLVLAALLAFSLSSAHAAPSPSGNPPKSKAPTKSVAQLSAEQGTVRKFYSSLMVTMDNGQKLGFDGRYKALDPVVREAFDMKNMARYATGHAWAKATPAEQKELVEAFTRFSVATYASRFTRNDGERFDVLGEKAQKNGSKIVETTLTPKDGKAVQLNYLVMRSRENALIMDVYLNGTISELATRRADFTAVIRRNGFQGLIKMLDEKVENMRKEG